jgi:hypothetical protein
MRNEGRLEFLSQSHGATKPRVRCLLRCGGCSLGAFVSWCETLRRARAALDRSVHTLVQLSASHAHDSVAALLCFAPANAGLG